MDISDPQLTYRTDDALVFEHVSFSYGSSEALHDVSLRIPRGTLSVVLGANGSGKSTLAKHMNALLVPSEGRVLVEGVDTAAESPIVNIRRGVGMVFQNPDDQAVASIVEDDVAFGPENLGIDPAEIRVRVDRALAAVDMEEFANREIAALSGGQKQRVAIAGALALEPRILVLDEPGAMLDPAGRERVMEIARGLVAEGMTVVLITHFMDEALEADNVFVLAHGSLVAQGAPAQALADTEALRRWHLQPPFVAALREALVKRGLGLPETLSIAQLEEALCR